MYKLCIEWDMKLRSEGDMRDCIRNICGCLCAKCGPKRKPKNGKSSLRICINCV